MTTATYAVNRQAAAGDHRRGRLPTPLAIFYPETDVIAAIDDPAETERAAGALRYAGILMEDV